MSIGSAIDRALRRSEELLAIDGVVQTFIWHNAEIPCTPQSKNSTIIIDDEHSSVLDVKRELLVRYSHFVTVDATTITIDSDLYTVDNNVPVPVTGESVEFPRGMEYRVVSAKVDPSRTFVKLGLTDAVGA